MKHKGLICLIRGYHKYNYYTSVCIRCGKKSTKDKAIS
jgi:hypothetical protein